MKKLSLTTVSLIATFLLIMGAFGDYAEAASGPKAGGVLRIISAEPPAGSIGVPEKMAGLADTYARAMIESLLSANLSGDLIPALSTNWEWSNNNKTLTLTLRQGVKFHDGSDFNADIVKWNWEQRIAAKVAGSEKIDSIEIIDDFKIRVNLKEYTNTWIYQLAGQGAGATLGMMISRSAIEKNGIDWAVWNAVGTGPYKFKEYKTDEYLEMERFDGYWGGKTYLDGVKWIFIKDPVTAQLAFEAKEADAIWMIGQASKLLHELVPKGYTPDLFGGLNFNLIPSSGNPDSPWSNEKVRMAAEYAIDKAKITKSIFHGYAEPRYQCAIKAQPPFDPDFKGRQYNPEKAKQLLKEAGYPKGFNTTLYCGMHLSGDDTTTIQAYLQAVGINAKLEIVSINKWIDLETNGWSDGIEVSPQGPAGFGFFLQRYWIRPDQPNWFSGLYWRTLNRPDELQNMILNYFGLADTSEQKAKSEEIVQYMYDHAVAIPLWEGMDVFMLQTYVRDTNFGAFPDGKQRGNIGFNYTKAWLDK